MKQIIVELDGLPRLMYTDHIGSVTVGTQFNIKGVRGNTWSKVECTAVLPNTDQVQTHGKHLRQTKYVVKGVTVPRKP